MVNCTEVRPGNIYIWDNQLYMCLNIDLNKTAMAKMKVKLKSKNVRTGATTEVSLIGGDKVEIVYVEKRKMGFLYDEGDSICFMDNETYDQVSIPKAILEWEMNFLISGVEVEIMTYNGEILGITLPTKVTLNITESEPAVRGDTSKTAMKDAVLETGLKVKVPIFVEQGEDIIVSTEDGSYVSRA
ncbi:MAG: elongation factor P [Erysipelotrichaceae bacterium]|nr:elongation factor P [Erysipelotrichaceae bacterium]